MEKGKHRKSVIYDAPPLLAPPKHLNSSYIGCSKIKKPMNYGAILSKSGPQDKMPKHMKDHLRKHNPLRFKFLQCQLVPKGKFIKIDKYCYYINSEGMYDGPFKTKEEYQEAGESMSEEFGSTYSQEMRKQVYTKEEQKRARSSTLFKQKKLLWMNEECPAWVEHRYKNRFTRDSESHFHKDSFYSVFKPNQLFVLYIPDNSPEYVAMYRDLGFKTGRLVKLKSDIGNYFTNRYLCCCVWNQAQVQPHMRKLVTFLIKQKYIITLDVIEPRWISTRQAPKEIAHLEWIKKYYPDRCMKNGLQTCNTFSE